MQEASNENAMLAEFGQLSLQPTTSGFAELAATATEAPAIEAVAMNTDPSEDPLFLLLESPVLKDDNILVDNAHPSWNGRVGYTYSSNGCRLTCNPNLILGVQPIQSHYKYDTLKRTCAFGI